MPLVRSRGRFLTRSLHGAGIPLEPILRHRYHRGVSEEEEGSQPPTYPPGFEPPTDVNVPWYAWVLWPLAVILALLATAILFHGCFGALS